VLRLSGPAIVVVLLLAATAVAFVRTQQEKLEPSPIGTVTIDRLFAPVCRCANDTAAIGFTLRRPDTITLELVDADREHVRTLAREERHGRGEALWTWDGRDDAGRLVADGSYRPRLTLASGARTFELPNPIRVDTVAPRVKTLTVVPRRISPDGDKRRDRVTLRYSVSEPAHALLFVDGDRVERTRFRPLQGRRIWNGKEGRRALPARTYELALAAEDAAGNVGPRRSVRVRIRYVELGRPRVRVPARARFRVGVLADAASFRWRFAGGTGVARPGVLVLRAPRKPGRYTLFVAAHGHGARAAVVVTPRPRAGSAQRPQAGR
jgi:hypothetical protein